MMIHDDWRCIMLANDDDSWFMIYDGLCWSMMIDDESCIMMTHDDAWFIVIVDASWWFMIICDLWCYITYFKGWFYIHRTSEVSAANRVAQPSNASSCWRRFSINASGVLQCGTEISCRYIWRINERIVSNIVHGDLKTWIPKYM